MTEASVAAPAPRVRWLELFFDLVFVVIVQRLTDVLHGEPRAVDFLIVVGLFTVVWTAWLNVTIFVNLANERFVDRRLPVLVSMAGVALMAVAIPDATGSAAFLFVLGLSVARLSIWFLWLRTADDRRLRATIYGPGSSAVWMASAFLPEPIRLGTWLVLAAAELISGASGFGHQRFVVAHLLERIGLFVMIVLGESVVELILAVRIDQSLLAWIVSTGSFVLICLLWWQYFENGTRLAEQVLRRSTGAALRDVVVIAHYFIVLALIGIAAGLGSAIEQADAPALSYGAVISLGGGVGLYHLANVLIAWRYGVRWVNLLVLGAVAVACAAAFAVFGTAWPAWIPVTLVVALMTADQTVLPWLWRQQTTRLVR